MGANVGSSMDVSLHTSTDLGVVVVVQQAKHLSKVCSSANAKKAIPPNSYVKYTWFKSSVTTHAIRGSVSPSWHHSKLCQIPLSLVGCPGHPLKRQLEFQVFHKVLQVQDGTVRLCI